MFYQEWKFVEDRCRILLEECGLTNETAIDSKDTLFLRFLSIAHSGLTFGRFNTLVLRFDLEGLGNDSIIAAKLKACLRFEYRDGYSQRYEPQIVSGTELELSPKFDDQESPVWEDQKKELKLTVMVLTNALKSSWRPSIRL